MKQPKFKMSLPGFAVYDPAWCEAPTATDHPDEREPMLTEWSDTWARRADEIARSKGN